MWWIRWLRDRAKSLHVTCGRSWLFWLLQLGWWHWIVVDVIYRSCDHFVFQHACHFGRKFDTSVMFINFTSKHLQSLPKHVEHLYMLKNIYTNITSKKKSNSNRCIMLMDVNPNIWKFRCYFMRKLITFLLIFLQVAKNNVFMIY